MRKKLLLTPYILMACIAMASVVRAPPATTIVAVDPSSITDVYPGDVFSINITITDVYAEAGQYGGVFNWILAIRWNGSVLRVAYDEWGKAMIKEGPFMEELGATSFLSAEPRSDHIPDITNAFLVYMEAEGSGTLVTITFNATGVGTTDITIYRCDFYDYPGRSIPCIVENGTATVIPEFPAHIILPLFLIATTTIAIIAKIAWSRRHRGYISAP